MRDRLAASAALWIADGIVIDPDSRLTQLGLIGSAMTRAISSSKAARTAVTGWPGCRILPARWAREVLGVENACPYIAPLPAAGSAGRDHGEPGGGRKREPSASSKGTLREISSANYCALLAATGASILVDKGASAEERASGGKRFATRHADA